jgi:hypothetical protein
VTAVAPPPAWPADPGHREAIDMVLDMAEAEARWGQPTRAIDLLDNVEQIVGVLPPRFELIRQRCRGFGDVPF